MRTAFPRQRIVKLKYVTLISIDPTAVAPFVEYIFRANSIHDPDLTGAGHQPMGHDQWSTWYSKYTVLGAKIRMQGLTVSSGIPMVFGVRTINTSTSGHTSVTGLMETPGASWRMLQSAINGQAVRPAYGFYSAKKYWNVADTKDNQATLGASFGSNPTNQAYFACWAAAHDGTSDLTDLRCLISITYIVALHEPKELPQS